MQYSTDEVAEMTGATFRQLSYGWSKGYLIASHPQGCGSGVALRWSTHELEVVTAIMSAVRQLRGTGPSVHPSTFADLARRCAPHLRNGTNVILDGADFVMYAPQPVAT